MVTAFFKMLSPLAKMPTTGHEGDAAFDLYSVEEVVIPKKGTGEVDIGIAWEPKFDGTMYTTPEERFYFHMITNFFKIQGIVKPRSGLSFKKDIETGAGVIEGTYRGRFKVKLYNNGSTPLEVHVGDRVAQLLVIVTPKVRARVTNNIEDTERGSNGFGSTGVN